MRRTDIRCICFDWGGTLMSEEGPADLPMTLWPEVRAIPGAAELLSALAPRYRLAVATNATVSDRPLIARALERVSLDRFLSDIFCSVEIGARKDDARFWDVVGSVLAVPPSGIVMVGDSLEQDVLAPLRFGIRSVWFNPSGRPGPPAVRVPVIRSLAELPPLLDAMP